MENKQSLSLVAISFSPGFTAPNIPIAVFSQEGKDLNFIIDTGSEYNVIDTSALKDIKYEEVDGDMIALHGVGGAQTTKPCVVTFQHDGKDYTAEFLASDLKESFAVVKQLHAIPLHGMLGSKFIRDNNLILDFTNMVAYNNEE
jgi:hypothetical protein